MWARCYVDSRSPSPNPAELGVNPIRNAKRLAQFSLQFGQPGPEGSRRRSADSPGDSRSVCRCEK
jgi:hypothetical protein